MDREEILARSKGENQGRDVADLEVSKVGMQIGWIVVVCLLAAVTVVDAMVFGRVNNEVFFAMMAGSAALFGFKYLKQRRRHELIVSLIYGFAAAAFLIGWILQLVKA